MKFVIVGATALAAAAFATPVLAQPVVENPGYCAQYYPDANCQNYGAGNPVGDPRGYYGDQNWRNGNAMMPRHVWHHTHRHQAAK